MSEQYNSIKKYIKNNKLYDKLLEAYDFIDKYGKKKKLTKIKKNRLDREKKFFEENSKFFEEFNDKINKDRINKDDLYNIMLNKDKYDEYLINFKGNIISLLNRIRECLEDSELYQKREEELQKENQLYLKKFDKLKEIKLGKKLYDAIEKSIENLTEDIKNNIDEIDEIDEIDDIEEKEEIRYKNQYLQNSINNIISYKIKKWNNEIDEILNNNTIDINPIIDDLLEKIDPQNIIEKELFYVIDKIKKNDIDLYDIILYMYQIFGYNILEKIFKENILSDELYKRIILQCKLY